MRNILRTIAIRSFLKSRKPKELMPSMVEDNERFVTMTMDELCDLTVAIIDEGVKPGLTELEASAVAKELKGMYTMMTILYNEIIDNRKWGEMKLNSAMRNLNLGDD